MKLNVKAFALTCSLIWGFGLFALAWWIMAFEGPTGEVTIIGQIYRGFSSRQPNWPGLGIGGWIRRRPCFCVAL
jgi:hypothetical protein